mmetsp:Transcript_30338/g.59633  ORF Transcript_30338/g.59633 Transcript_30338/m.59633 type:complete len:86 (-) Transcript_30338:1367-1624(-)
MQEEVSSLYNPLSPSASNKHTPSAYAVHTHRQRTTSCTGVTDPLACSHTNHTDGLREKEEREGARRLAGHGFHVVHLFIHSFPFS